MRRSEYVKIKNNDIPTEFIDGYNLQAVLHNRWVYFEITRGCYGLPQSGKLAKNWLHTCLNKAGYSETVTTPGLWKHTWRPIQFFPYRWLLWNWICGVETYPPHFPSPPRVSWNIIILEGRQIRRHWPGMELCPQLQWPLLPTLNPRIRLKTPCMIFPQVPSQTSDIDPQSLLNSLWRKSTSGPIGSDYPKSWCQRHQTCPSHCGRITLLWTSIG